MAMLPDSKRYYEGGRGLATGTDNANAIDKIYIPKVNSTPAKVVYSLKLIKMNCGNPSVRPFIPLRKNHKNKVSNEWTEKNPNPVKWGFIGNGRVDKFKVFAQFEFTNDEGNDVPVIIEALDGKSIKADSLGMSNEVANAHE